jgi:hypothetical protein
MVTKQELDGVLIEINNILKAIDKRITDLEKAYTPKPATTRKTTAKK